MKIIKKALIACFIILLLFAVIVRVPFVQRNVVTHFLKKHFHEVYLDSISVGLSSAQIKNLSLSAQTIDIKLDNANISWSVHDLLFAKKLTIDDICLNGLIVSHCDTQEKLLANKSDSEQQIHHNTKLDIDKVQAQLQKLGQLLTKCTNPRMPTGIVIKHIKTTGILDINELLVADVIVESNTIAPMATTTATINADISIENGQHVTATFDGVVNFSQTENGTITNLSLKTQCNCFDNNSTLEKSLNCAVTFANTTTDKTLSVAIDGMEDDKSLLTLAIDFNPSTNILTAQCYQNFDIATLSQLFPSQELPRFETKLSINGEINLKSFEGMAKGTIDATLSKNIINLFLPEICSDITFSSDIAFLFSEHNIKLHSLDGMINSSDDSIKILFFTPSPIIIWNELQGLVFAQNIKNSQSTVLTIDVENFNPSSLFSTSSIVNTNISWKFDISPKNDAWHITSHDDNLMVARNLSLRFNNKKCLHATKFSCQPQFIFGNSTKITINNMQLNDTNDESIIDGTITIDRDAQNNFCHINGYLVSDLNKLAHIPYCSCENEAISGIISSEFDYKQTENYINATTDIRLKSLNTNTSKSPISGTLSANYIKSNGDYTLSMPINIDGQHSTSLEIDIAIHKNVDQAQTLYDTTATLNGDCLSITDMTEVGQTVVKLAKGNNRRIRSKLTTINHQNYINNQKNSISNLFNHNGKISTNIEKVLISDHVQLNNFDAFLTLNNDTIELKLLNFAMADSPINAFGTITLIPNKTSHNQQYNISFNTTAECRDIAKLYTTILPSKIPAISGTGTAQLSISANETSLNNIMDNLNGELSITCNNGTILPFNLMSMNATTIMDTIEIASRMIFRDGLSGSNNSKTSNIYNLKQELQNVDYDNIDIYIKRDDNKNFVIKKCDITGPTLHVYATGNIQYLKHKSIDSFPLSIIIHCDAAGELGRAMDNLGLITDKPRHATYMQGPRCTIKGTIGHPDYSSFIELLYPLF